MKQLCLVIFLSLLFACDSEDAPDCFKSAGPVVRKEFTVDTFDKIRIEDDVELEIRQGTLQKVVLETGENLLTDIEVKLEGSTLVISNTNSCNLFRDYPLVKAVVESPNISEIRNSSIGDIRSDGVLDFPTLVLISNTTGNLEDSRKSGDFYLEVECERFQISANGFSRFFISGYAEAATIAFEDEVPLFEGAQLIVDDLVIFQRSANIMRVNPRLSIKGDIRGTGDVISVFRPPVVDVEESYTGRLIFQD